MRTRIASLSLLVAMGGAVCTMSMVSSCSDDKVGYVSSQQGKDNSVKFVLQGVGSLPTQVLSSEIDEKGKVTPPKEEDFGSVKSCYKFDGKWFKENTCETPWDASKDSATGNTILYGNWSIVDSIEVAGHKGYFMGTFNAKNDPVYWATTNIGTDKPENFGDYYAWGDTATHYHNSVQDTVMKEWNYNYYNGDNQIMLTEDDYPNLWKTWLGWTDGYAYNTHYGYDEGDYVINPETLPDSVDIAKILWGDGWRMPSAEDFSKLYGECDFVWDTLNRVPGVYAYRKKSKSTTKTCYGPSNSQSTYSKEDIHIFFPTTGCLAEDFLNQAGLSGGYWSSSLSLLSQTVAYCFSFSNECIYPAFYAFRNYGNSVRAVYVPNE